MRSPASSCGTDSARRALVSTRARLHDTEERRVIVAAHYDGASESASGPAFLIELTRALINAPVAPHVGVDIVLLDAFGAAWFANHLRDIYGTQGPSSALVVDAACRGDVRVLTDLARVGDSDVRREPATGDPLAGCSVAGLEAAARKVLDYVNASR